VPWVTQAHKVFGACLFDELTESRLDEGRVAGVLAFHLDRQSQPIGRLQRFKPGDLVAGQDLNLLVDAMRDLDRRLGTLEAAFRKLRAGKG
jgi:hypothetical protein